MVMACSTLMQIAVIDQALPLERITLRAHMRALVLGYLRERSNWSLRGRSDRTAAFAASAPHSQNTAMKPLSSASIAEDLDSCRRSTLEHLSNI
jgi:hypothetical protein